MASTTAATRRQTNTLNHHKPFDLRTTGGSTSSKSYRGTPQQNPHLEQIPQFIDADESMSSSMRTKGQTSPNSLAYSRYPESEEDDLIQLTNDLNSLKIRISKCTRAQTYQQGLNVDATIERVDLLTPLCLVCSKNIKIDNRFSSGNVEGTQHYCENHNPNRLCHGTNKDGTPCRKSTPNRELIKGGVEWYCFQHNPANDHLQCLGRVVKGKRCEIRCSKSEIRLGNKPYCNKHFSQYK
ncbi:hypothetical protein BCR41DRAFT_363718 [Lobosporangium transversale]|uniref:Uncharacterized protein n=1 Tax=Lobosporangium transversale TaxID=64571 RepID=A0A1Y2G7D7_9FUNG|nr:hypothetical protein BCR41DRAFT_363718 [Lobosporangium transversale]ORY99774.1 hypothetical protein BCR41DRAFT_363718 [Lobosporangium transversale]|eukprot:XP_021876008.1 hypothetical protein BCR41DRAFT_363718 [Lobosporangium transversale]